MKKLILTGIVLAIALTLSSFVSKNDKNTDCENMIVENSNTVNEVEQGYDT